MCLLVFLFLIFEFRLDGRLRRWVLPNLGKDKIKIKTPNFVHAIGLLSQLYLCRKPGVYTSKKAKGKAYWYRGSNDTVVAELIEAVLVKGESVKRVNKRAATFRAVTERDKTLDAVAVRNIGHCMRLCDLERWKSCGWHIPCARRFSRQS